MQRIFVGVIGVGAAKMPYSAVGDTVTTGGSRTVGPPLGINVGDIIVACVTAGDWGGLSTTYTLTRSSGWTAVFEDPPGLQIITNLYYRIATADDVAGTTSYTWTYTSDTAGGRGMTVVHLSWPARYGTALSAASVDHTTSPSVPSPGGAWQFAYITQRTASVFLQPDPDPVITSPATLLHFESGRARAGPIRAYASYGVSPVVGAYLPTGTASTHQGLVVAAVAPRSGSARRLEDGSVRLLEDDTTRTME